MVKVYAIFSSGKNLMEGEKKGDLIMVWPHKWGRDFAAGEVVECEFVVPERKKPTTVSTMVK
jgi:hypothetical protein